MSERESLHPQFEAAVALAAMAEDKFKKQPMLILQPPGLELAQVARKHSVGAAERDKTLEHSTRPWEDT